MRLKGKYIFAPDRACKLIAVKRGRKRDLARAKDVVGVHEIQILKLSQAPVYRRALDKMRAVPADVRDL